MTRIEGGSIRQLMAEQQRVSGMTSYGACKETLP